MAMSGGTAEGEPIGEMNTTPLIDVMLVLLIMILTTIPPQTHAVKVDLPQNSNTPKAPIEADKNKVLIDPAGNVFWNGSPIDEVTLAQYLDRTTAMNPEPELHFQPDRQARYERVDQILAVIKRANVTKLGFVGNEQYRSEF